MYLVVFIVEQNLAGIDAIVSVLRSLCLEIHTTCHSLYGPLYENMTSSTKPEVHNVSQQWQHHRRRTKPRGHKQHGSNMHKNWWSSGTWFSRYASGQTDWQANRQTDVPVVGEKKTIFQSCAGF